MCTGCLFLTFNLGFILSPQNITVGLGHPPLAVVCHINGTNIYWIINGAPVDSSNIAQFRDMGIHFANSVPDGELISAELTVDISKATNNTEIVCEAQTGSVVELSNPATVTVAG